MLPLPAAHVGLIGAFHDSRGPVEDRFRPRAAEYRQRAPAEEVVHRRPAERRVRAKVLAASRVDARCRYGQPTVFHTCGEPCGCSPKIPANQACFSTIAWCAFPAVVGLKSAVVCSTTLSSRPRSRPRGVEQPIELTADSLWSEVAGRLRGALNESTYRTWFGEVRATRGTGRARARRPEQLHA